ncbi:ADP-ribosyltransferase exoenzyme [Micromonospora sp. M71_S20]|uniref:phage minor capsid protein n=1 Tax=Micromonospora sp. M71_S20 TaxID=592872 RepID=UPI000EAFECA8|nr:phage minor capsid protein [Micromonospora sp. M71_S20]RLK13317.1 ADP-ribosyltransferase exoenzyme [Micromonospora sp. M71_S20]
MALTGDQIEQASRSTVDLYRGAEQAILAEVTRRLAAGQDAPDWAVTRLAALGSLRQAVERVLTLVAGRAPDLIHEMLAAAYRSGQGIATRDLPASLLRDAPDLARAAGTVPRIAVAENLASALVTDIEAKHSAVLRRVTDVYRQVIAQATAVSVAGGMTRRQASQWAYQRFIDQGVTSFVDSGGRRWRLSSYVEMGARTVTQRAAVQGQTDRLSTLGVDTVIVSDSPRECERCRPWEGKVLSIGGGQRGRVELRSMVGAGTVTVDIAGTVDEARAAGLQHPNCTHSLRAYLPGATKRPARPTANPQGYEAKERQREIERQIRKWKEREAGALDDVGKATAAAKVKAWQGTMRDHLAANPELKRLPYREQIGAGNTPPKPTTASAPPARPTPASGRAALDAAPINVRSDAAQRQLTADERDAVYQYRGSLYANLNGALRRAGGRLPTGFAFEFFRDATKQLDRAIRKSRLTADVLVHRGIADPLAVFGPAAGRALPAGARWTEHAYVSSTAARAVAEEFARSGAVLTIRVPRGTGALQLSGTEYESELLLERGLTLRVVSDTGPGPGRQIVAEVVR